MAVYKNIASQLIAVYAHDTAADAPETGDAANITAQISKDGGATAATNDVNPTELDAGDAPGIYIFSMTQAETNADMIVLYAVSATADISIEPVVIYTVPGTNAGVDADVVAISGDTTAPDNLEAMFDGTGYVDPYAPSTQSQLDDIALTGAALNEVADSATITTGSQTNTYTATWARDNTYHQVEEVGNAIDFYYEFDISDGVPVEVTIIGRLDEGSPPSGGDSVDIYAYNWGGAAWEHISPVSGDFIGINASTSADDSVKVITLFSRHVGTGGNAGLVRIRLEGAALEGNTEMYVDQLYVSYAVVPAVPGDQMTLEDGAITTAKFAVAAITAAVLATDAIGAAELAADAVAEIADQVWDELIAGHLGAGSTGEALNAAGAAGDPWHTAVPGAYPAGDAGYILGNILADIWGYTTRTLTQSAASITSAVSGDEITVTRGDEFTAEITSLGNITGYKNVWFTVKQHIRDTDANALIQVDSDTGLLRIQKAAPTAAGNATLTVDDAAAGDITIVIDAVETAKLSPAEDVHYDIQWQDASDDIHTLSLGNGEATIQGDVTRAIS